MWGSSAGSRVPQAPPTARNIASALRSGIDTSARYLNASWDAGGGLECPRISAVPCLACACLTFTKNSLASATCTEVLTT